jgi:hypothetical protein
MARAKLWLDVHGTDLHRYGEQQSVPPPKGRRRLSID